ncbi:MAG: DUF853 family protein [Lutispora sp.]|nr:DUF853 family protein [Lutispora sp.]
MSDMHKLQIAKGDEEIYIFPKMANRHGLIAGATGTGKTITLKVLAEKFSSIGVPVFMADIKGDLASICNPGISSPKIDERISNMGLAEFSFQGFPTVLWDVFGRLGHPVRTTISEMGPLLLSRLLGLNDTQTGVLNIVFKIADDTGMMLIDLKDLKSMLQYVGDNSKEFTTEYGTITKQSIGAIQRGLLTLEGQGAENFFAEPALDIMDLIKTDSNGFGNINILASEQLFHSPALYSTFLLWLLSELFEELPEVGDMEKPKIVFFFDEAHLLFNEAPKVLLDKIEQVVRLIRSKGVGVYFITQNPIDVPDKVLGQLGNRVQHALRAFTPRDQKAVNAAAETFRANPKLDVKQAITELRVGEALVSVLDLDGRPTVVERAFIVPPRSFIGTISDDNRSQLIRTSKYYNKYERMIDRESAYEMLQRKYAQDEKAALEAERETARAKEREHYEKQRKYDYGYGAPAPRGRKKASSVEKMAQSTINSIGRTVGRELVRGIFGSLLKK